MTEGDVFRSASGLIGMAVLSRSSGNKLGEVDDLLVDPASGELLGLGVRRDDSLLGVVGCRDVHSFGKDAVMVADDESLIPSDGVPWAAAPLAGRDLTGANVVTEGGTLLGQVAAVYFLVGAPPPPAFYEVRESLLDKLLGRGLFIPASAARALSDDARRLIVPEGVAGRAAASLEELSSRLLSPSDDRRVVVRSHNPDDEDETLVR